MLPLQAPSNGIDDLRIDRGRHHLPVAPLAEDRIGRYRHVVVMWAEQRVRLSERQGTVARPTVVARVGDHGRAQGIEFDVAVAVHQVVAAVHDAGFVAPFPECAGTVVGLIDVADVPSPERLQGPRDGACALRGEEQVHVVRHQHVGVHRTAFALGDLLQFPPVAEVVGFGEEAGLAIVATLHDMLGKAGEIDAKRAGHGEGLRGDAAG